MKRIGIFAISTVVLLQAPVVSAEQTQVLRHNPFDKPEILAQPVREKGKQQAARKEKPPVLGGTLVSTGVPMVILDGELLGIGEQHGGYRLLAVEEGAATFEKQGQHVELLVADSADDSGSRK